MSFFLLTLAHVYAFNIYIVSVHEFPGNHGLGIVSNMLYCLSELFCPHLFISLYSYGVFHQFFFYFSQEILEETSPERQKSNKVLILVQFQSFPSSGKLSSVSLTVNNSALNSFHTQIDRMCFLCGLWKCLHK